MRYTPFRRTSSWNSINTYLPKIGTAVWSPLEESFNTKPSDLPFDYFIDKKVDKHFKSSPLYSTEFYSNYLLLKGLFEYEQLVDHVGLIGMKMVALQRKDQLLNECLNPNRFS